MPLHDELLTQARVMAVLDGGVPFQANLRRAVSSAYYALFHLFIAESVVLLIPGSPIGLQARITRAFGHKEMNQVCASFSAKHVPDDLRALLSNQEITRDLREIAGTFRQLQQARHSADYDITFNLTRLIALSRVEEAERAFQLWNALEPSDEKAVFLTAIAFGSRWSK